MSLVEYCFKNGGADNGSSTAFIKAMSPEYVIFSAGHAHRHPRASTAKRYLDFGVEIEKIFRTDKGDDEQNTQEWSWQKIDDCIDGAGDDDVRIKITSDGLLTVRYLEGDNGCEQFSGE